MNHKRLFHRLFVLIILSFLFLGLRVYSQNITAQAPLGPLCTSITINPNSGAVPANQTFTITGTGCKRINFYILIDSSATGLVSFHLSPAEIDASGNFTLTQPFITNGQISTLTNARTAQDPNDNSGAFYDHLNIPFNVQITTLPTLSCGSPAPPRSQACPTNCPAQAVNPIDPNSAWMCGPPPPSLTPTPQFTAPETCNLSANTTVNSQGVFGANLVASIDDLIRRAQNGSTTTYHFFMKYAGDLAGTALCAFDPRQFQLGQGPQCYFDYGSNNIRPGSTLTFGIEVGYCFKGGACPYLCSKNLTYDPRTPMPTIGANVTPSPIIAFDSPTPTQGSAGQTYQFQPCSTNTTSTADILRSTGNGVSTPFGCLPTTPGGLVTALFQIAIGIAGGIAFLLIIVGGIRILSSSGNPEAMNEGKEVITSAIVGLLVIVFSVFILRVVGVDILAIPGFRP